MLEEKYEPTLNSMTFPPDTHTCNDMSNIYNKERANNIDRCLFFGQRRRERKVYKERDFNLYTGGRGWSCKQI